MKKETALDYATTDVPVAYPHQTVGEVLKLLRSRKWGSACYVFVLKDEKGRKLEGFIPIQNLLVSSDDAKISTLIRKEFPSVGAGTKAERAAILAINHDIDTIPVVETSDGRFLGAVDADDLLRILHSSHTERLLKRAGVLGQGKVIDIFRARVSTLVKLRLPWLLIGLLGGMVAVMIVSRFEFLLQRVVTIAFFIPTIAYMNGAVGTQSVALFIRGLTLERISLRRYIWRELQVGVLLGAVLGSVIFAFAWVAFGSLQIAQAVGISMFLGISVATVNALICPYVLFKMGKDPAFGSDALVTVVQDILSISIYLAVSLLLVF